MKLKKPGFVNIIEKQQSQKIACLEEIAFRKGWLEKSFISNIQIGAICKFASFLEQMVQRSNQIPC